MSGAGDGQAGGGALLQQGDPNDHVPKHARCTGAAQTEGRPGAGIVRIRIQLYSIYQGCRSRVLQSWKLTLIL